MKLEILIAGLTLGQFSYYMAWAFLGQGISVFWQQYKYFPRIQTEGGFSPVYWMKKNWPRLIGSFVIAAIAVAYIMNKAKEIDEWEAVMGTFMVDRTIESLTNRKK